MKDAEEINKRIWVKIRNIAQDTMAFNIGRAAGGNSIVETLGSLPTPNFKMLGSMGNRLNSFKEAADIGAAYSAEANELNARSRVDAAKRAGQDQRSLIDSQNQSNLLGSLGQLGGAAINTFGGDLLNNFNSNKSPGIDFNKGLDFDLGNNSFGSDAFNLNKNFFTF